MSRPAIGRGLNALFDLQASSEGGVREIPLDSLTANPDQPRVDFDDQQLEELAESIRANGVIQPVVARPMGDIYQVVTGERRLRAARRAGLHRIPVVVRQDLDDQDALFLGLIENLQRQDLNAVEEARSLERLHEETGLTHDQIAQRLGKSRAHVTNTLRLLRLPEEILGWVRRGALSAGHARALLGLDLESQMVDVAAQVVEEGWSVRRLEQFVRDYASARDARKPAPPARRLRRPHKGAEKALAARFDCKVSIQQRQGQKQGTITLKFRNREHLAQMLESMGVQD